METKPIEKKLSIWDRLKAETPKFWRHIGILGASVLGLGISLAAAQKEYILPFLNPEIPGYLIVIGTVMGALAPLAVKTPPDCKPAKPTSTADGDDL